MDKTVLRVCLYLRRSVHTKSSQARRPQGCHTHRRTLPTTTRKPPPRRRLLLYCCMLCQHLQGGTIPSISGSSRRTYYTSSEPTPPPYPPTETTILSAALTHVPTHGFTQEALTQGALTAGYLPASTNLFPRGAFDLVLYHLVTQRLALKDRVQFPPPSTQDETRRPPGTGAKVRTLMLERLRANEPVIHKYSEAIALMSLGENIATALAELARLSDEIWFLAGDTSLDTSWYTKRGLLAGVYASAEVFMTQDRSVGFVETEGFVDRRLDGVRRLGGAVGSVVEWVGYTGMSTVNVVRSLGVRI